MFAEVAKGSALGLEAKAAMDRSQTVPDECFLQVPGEPGCLGQQGKGS